MSYHPWFLGVVGSVPQDGHDRCLTCLGIQHAEGFRGWFMFFLWGHDHLGVAYRLRLSNWRSPSAAIRRSSRHPGPAASGGVRGDLRITVRLPQEESLTPQALRSRWVCRWNGLGPLQSGVHHPFPSVLPLTTRCRSLHRRVSSLSPGMTTRLRCPLRCGSVVRARPRDDGYAFPGRRECRARVESSTASRSFEAGRVVSRWGSRWFSAPPSGAILSGSA